MPSWAAGTLGTVPLTWSEENLCDDAGNEVAPKRQQKHIIKRKVESDSALRRSLRTREWQCSEYLSFTDQLGRSYHTAAFRLSHGTDC